MINRRDLKPQLLIYGRLKEGFSMKKFLLILLAMALLSLPTAANIGEPKGFLGKVYSNTFALYGHLGTKTLFDCTASIYDKTGGGYLMITAGHCIQDVPEGVQFSVSEQIGGELMPVKVLKVREEGSMDFAQLELDTKKVYPVTKLGDESTLAIGDSVINANFADSIGKQISLGRVATKELTPTRDCPEECKDGFLIQVFGSGGSSGSAVISKKTHKIVGIVVWGFDVNVGMGVEPISRFQTFLQMPTQAHPPAATVEDEVDHIIQIIIGGK
jgi:hypothetical protein